MNNVNHISQDDLYLFSLQFLSENEMTMLRNHLQHCQDCHRQLGWIQGDLAIYSLTAPVAEVPLGSKERLMRRVSEELNADKKIVAIDANRAADVSSSASGLAAMEPVLATRKVTPFTNAADTRRTRMGFAGWAGWAIAAGVAVAGGLQFQQRQTVEQALSEARGRLDVASSDMVKVKAVLDTITSPASKQAALHLTSAGTAALPEARASYLPATGSIVLTASHLNQLLADTTYELWIIPADKTAPIPAGTFKPTANGEATLVKMDLPKGVAAGAFGITIEHDGGTTTPTMPIVLVGD